MGPEVDQGSLERSVPSHGGPAVQILPAPPASLFQHGLLQLWPRCPGIHRVFRDETELPLFPYYEDFWLRNVRAPTVFSAAAVEPLDFRLISKKPGTKPDCEAFDYY